MNILRRAFYTVAVLSLFNTTPLLAEPRFLSESDTGVIFGDQDCMITDAQVDPEIRLAEDPFQYLHATVTAVFTCVDRTGVIHTYRGQDSVLFPLATFDWETQGWSMNGEAVAKRNTPYGVGLASGVEARVWKYVDDVHLAFKVELWK